MLKHNVCVQKSDGDHNLPCITLDVLFECKIFVYKKQESVKSKSTYLRPGALQWLPAVGRGHRCLRHLCGGHLVQCRGHLVLQPAVGRCDLTQVAHLISCLHLNLNFLYRTSQGMCRLPQAHLVAPHLDT